MVSLLRRWIEWMKFKLGFWQQLYHVPPLHQPQNQPRDDQISAPEWILEESKDYHQRYIANQPGWDDGKTQEVESKYCIYRIRFERDEAQNEIYRVIERTLKEPFISRAWRRTRQLLAGVLSFGVSDRARCPNCHASRRRYDRDRFVRCHDCGWTAGVPVLRWLTYPTWPRFYLSRPRRIVGDGLRLLVVWLLVSAAVVYLTPVAVYVPLTVADLHHAVAVGAGVANDTATALQPAEPEAAAADPAGSSVASANDEPTTRSEGELDLRRAERLVAEKTNAYRREQGLGSVSYSEEIARIARSHSRDMASVGRLFHDRLGDTMVARYRPVCGRGSGENAAYTYVDRRVIQSDGDTIFIDSTEELADSLVEQWINSPGHRRNMLRERWSRIGVGLYREEGTGKVWASQTFC